RHFGARLLVVAKDDHGGWPAVLNMSDPNAGCFEELPLRRPPGIPTDAPEALPGWRAFRVLCESGSATAGRFEESIAEPWAVPERRTSGE
ncbi:MAG: hypothetical protein ACJ77N_09005, partial [Chloroflexota bacterium]